MVYSSTIELLTGVPVAKDRATAARDFVQIAALHKEVAGFLRFGLGDTATFRIFV